jgi:hypothetical protein
MNFLSALVGLTGPIVARVLLTLGFSVVTITGVAVTLTTIKGHIQLSLGQLPTAIAQLAGLAGAWDALALVFGAATFVVSLHVATSATKLVGTGA